MEESGVGMDTYKGMRDKYKLPLPLITYEDPNLIVTFPRTADAVRSLDKTEVLSQLNDEELAGLDFAKTKGEVSRKEYEDYFGFERKKASNQLKRLKSLGLIDDNGKPSTSHDFRYVYKEENKRLMDILMVRLSMKDAEMMLKVFLMDIIMVMLSMMNKIIILQPK